MSVDCNLVGQRFGAMITSNSVQKDINSLAGKIARFLRFIFKLLEEEQISYFRPFSLFNNIY